MNLSLKSAIAALVFAAPSLAFATEYVIDPAHSNAQFSVRHMMVSNVRGEFNKVSGKVNLDDKDVTKTTIEATIDATSINTRVADRDTHLKSADFFDVAKFPTITFKSKSVKKAGNNKLKVTGDLTIRDVTKQVVLDVEGPSPEVKDPWGAIKRGAVATTKINRKDFGLGWNQALETGGVLVGDEVAITIDVEFDRVQPAQQDPNAANK